MPRPNSLFQISAFFSLLHLALHPPSLCSNPDSDNCPCIHTEMETRAAKRRPETAALPRPENQSLKKKRVVLGELANIPNNPVVPETLNQLKPKNLKVKRAAAPKISLSLTDSILDDPKIRDPFVSDIYEYLRTMERETKRRPTIDYIEKVQRDVSPNMRGILVDWLVEVAEEYKLLSDTLYLSISYIDRFLSINPVSKQRLQLLGVSSMLIASKYEEISPPGVQEFCYITDNTYTKAEVVEMEADILKSLNYEMGNPTVKTFLRTFAGTASESLQTSNLQYEFLGNYLAELSLLDYDCIKFLPSLVAASVIFLARFIMWPKVHPWTLTLRERLGYKSVELKECVLILHDLYLARRGGSFQAIREKYRQHKLKYVANMSSPLEIPISYFEEE